MLRYGDTAKMHMTAAEEAALDRVNSATDLYATAPWTSGTDATGGYAVPFSLDPTLTNTASGANCPPRRIARVQVVTGNEAHYVTMDGVVAVYAAGPSAIA